jgi:hypothetical protein
LWRCGVGAGARGRILSLAPRARRGAARMTNPSTIVGVFSSGPMAPPTSGDEAPTAPHGCASAISRRPRARRPSPRPAPSGRSAPPQCARSRRRRRGAGAPGPSSALRRARPPRGGGRRPGRRARRGRQHRRARRPRRRKQPARRRRRGAQRLGYATLDVAGVGEEQAVVEAIPHYARRDRRVGVTFACARGEA